METIAIIFLAMAGIVLTMAVALLIMFYRPLGDDEYFTDDAPAHYEDYELSERPFVEY